MTFRRARPSIDDDLVRRVFLILLEERIVGVIELYPSGNFGYTFISSYSELAVCATLERMDWTLPKVALGALAEAGLKFLEVHCAGEMDLATLLEQALQVPATCKTVGQPPGEAN